MDIDDGSTHGDLLGSRRRLEPKRVILILTETGIISDKLIDALEREFPRVVVEQVDNVEAACAPFAHPVALILVDFALLKEAEHSSEALLHVHPYSQAAVIQPDDKRSLLPLTDIAESSLIRSVLAMDLKLDIWLAIIRLMLCGGQYFPPEMIVQSKLNITSFDLLSQEDTAVFSHDRERRLAALTARETQILTMAASGLQNKLIASELNLSEHTVKTHVRNIIGKLGVHNRTEAAARLHIC